MMNQLCLCGPRGHAVPPLLVEDAGGRADPTGTARLASQFQADMDRRWRAVRVAMVGAVQKFAVPHPAHGGDPVRAFQSWLDETMRQVVLGGTGIWMLKYLRQSEAMAVARGQRLASSSAQPRSRLQSLLTMAGSELQGIMDATSQQATRAFAAGLLVGNPANNTARTVAATADTVGKARGRLLTQFFIVRVFSAATLDAFRAAGVRRVGTKAEAKPTSTKRRTLDAKPAPKGKKLSELFEKEEKVQSLGEVDVLTAGDDDVCEICEDISDGGPYDIDTAESLIPAHPRCRCAFVPTDDDRFAEVGDAFDPSEPRDENGRWANAGFGQKSGEATAELYKIYDKTLGKNELTSTEKDALTKYTGDNFLTINKGLRAGRSSGIVTQLDSALSKTSLPRDMVLYRGVGTTLADKVFDKWNKSDGQPIEFTDRAFVSTSARRNVAKNFSRNIMEVRVPKGSHGLPVPNGNEDEIILKRDSKFRVVKVQRMISGKKIVAELVA